MTVWEKNIIFVPILYFIWNDKMEAFDFIALVIVILFVLVILFCVWLTLYAMFADKMKYIIHKKEDDY